jgi:hypothetical protein
MLDIVMLARRLRTQGCTVVLRNPQPQIVTLVEIVGLDRLPGVRVERPAAPLAAVGQPAPRARLAHA